MKRLMKGFMRLISRLTHTKFWTLLAAGLVLFIAGLAAGIVYKKSVGIDLACSFLFIAGIVLISMAVSRAGGGEAARPAARVEEPKVKPVARVEETDIKPVSKKKRGAKRKQDATPDTVSWNI